MPRKAGVRVASQDKFVALEAAYGKVCRERDALQRKVEELRNQLNLGREFPGDSRDLFTATYKGNYVPTQEQLYAAKSVLQLEHPTEVLDSDGGGPVSRVVLTLPHNFRDDKLVVENGLLDGETLATWYREHAEQVRRFDERLRDWVKSKQLSDRQAALVRTMWVQHNDPPWADVAPPLPAIPYLPQQPEPAPLSNGHHSVSNAFGPEPSVSNAELVDMVAAPNSLWQVESGKLYRADGRGDVLGVHPADVAELEEMGVKRR